MSFIRIMISFLYFLYIIAVSSAVEEFVDEQQKPVTVSGELTSPIEEIDSIDKILDIIVKLATVAEKSKNDGVLPAEHTDGIYDQIIEAIEDLNVLFKTSDYAYKFLNTNGINKIITPILSINYEPMKKELLILLKTLFKTAPATTKQFIPLNVIDKLLDIFENDENLALKTHALDIMYNWLPGNPKIQARVMKLKGLEPFYDQISKLDTSVVYTLLDLFNQLLEEHLMTRDRKLLKNKDDFEDIVLYERIGLLERMSTSAVCNGLLNIFESLSFRDDVESSPTFFDLLKNIKPFCLKYFKGKTQAAKVFESIKKYLVPRDSFNGNKVTNIKTLIDDYIEKINSIRDEF